jgi:hypothetical protein
MSIKCIGCDSPVPWDGKGLFCYTCPCGAHIFYDDETGRPVIPVSLAFALHYKKKDVPHLDYLIGESDYTSPVKEEITRFLIERGAIWMKDCEQCRQDGTYQQKLERDKYIAMLEAERR